MIDLQKLVTTLDAIYNCHKKESCNACRSLYKIDPEEAVCTAWVNKDNTLEALKAIERWLDTEYDINQALGTKPRYEVNEEEFMRIISGE